ncbi:MAG: hypothetical protein GX298_08730 [Planctomycetes bacterium]|jgi:hypothetical protein|nr:hypothetical protein [Planctomycetota bacterium]
MNEHMTIQCDCPQCGRVCGFKSQFAGRIARCLTCDARFVIPSESGQPAHLCKPQPAPALPGFYANAMKGSIKAFFHRDSCTGLIFCAALVIFHFFLGNEDMSFTLPGFRPPLLIGWTVTLITFGGFSWYCLQVILDTQMGSDSLPSVDMGSGFEFIWNVIKSCYLFLISLLLALLPASLISAGFESFGIDIGAFFYVLVGICLLLWPINLAILALGVPWWRIFRYDLLIKAIVKTFWPYMFTTLFTLIAFYVVFLGMALFAPQDDANMRIVAGALALRLGGAVLFLFAMRIIGTYCLHYSDVCPDLWAEDSAWQPGLD